MLNVRILSGKDAGTVRTIRRFPCLIGRSASTDLRLEEPGVWDRHLRLEFVPGDGITLRVLPGALAALNGQPVEVALLRNGDLIELGATKLEFQLGPTRQRSFRLREIVTWTLFGLFCAGEILLIAWLLR